MKMDYKLVLVFGVVFLVAAVYFFQKSLDFIQSGTKTVATVIELRKTTDSDGKWMYQPIFRFQTLEREEMIFEHSTSSSSPSFEVGEKVDIVYDPSDPGKAKLLTYFGAFSWTIILLCIALPLIVIGGGYFYTQQYLH
jgi:hypothetical protein